MLKSLLFPFSFIYGVVVSLRNFCYDAKIFKQHEFEIPIIAVGNITVGGTGKTPHAEYLIRILRKQFNVAFLSRGYKRKTRGFILATTNSTLDQIGDEPVQIKQKMPELPVAVSRKRVVGIKKLLEIDPEIDAIVLDDAFQHRAVKPNINILLIDYTRQIFNDKLMPVGKLRESARAKYRANIIIFTKCPSQLQPIEQRIIKNKLDIRPYQHLFFTTIVYGEITPSEKGFSLFSNDMRKYTVLLVTGIGNPAPLVDYLTPQVGEIIHCPYPDHYAYKASDLEEIDRKYKAIGQPEKMIITTEKDLVRLKSVKVIPEYFFRNVYFIPIEIKFLDKKRDLFNQRILNYVTENRSNSKISQRKNGVHR